jgi:hypothetical protein
VLLDCPYFCLCPTESYHKKVISEQKAEIKKLKLDTQKLETAESEKRKANKSMAYFKKQNVFLLTAFINKFG